MRTKSNSIKLWLSIIAITCYLFPFASYGQGWKQIANVAEGLDNSEVEVKAASDGRIWLLPRSRYERYGEQKEDYTFNTIRVFNPEGKLEWKLEGEIKVIYTDSLLLVKREDTIMPDLPPNTIAPRNGKGHLMEVYCTRQLKKLYEFRSVNDQIQELTILFKTAAIPIRKNRTPPRKKTSYARSYNFQLRKKKHVY
jgi:hypothetical protein